MPTIDDTTKGYYTGIGSRDAPEDILMLITRLAKRLSEMGWVVRSGGADGCDSAFFEGCGVKHEIYLPWSNFNNHHHRTFIIAPNLPNYSQAEEIASTIHPVWDKLSRGAKALHTRNVYQIQGITLDNPSKAVVCWAKPIGDGHKVKGGTGTAVALARELNIPVFNLYYQENIDKVLKILT